MRTRKLGFTELDLTIVGFGAWAIGGGGWQFGWGPQDDGDSIAAIHRALDLGINWIDTAAVYGLGHSEEVVARAIEGRREKVIVATKCGLVWNPGSTEPHGRLKAESVRHEIENSLRRLRLDRIDLYQIHWPDPEDDIEEGWAVIMEAIRAGKIRYGGVSNFGVQHLERVRKIHPVASLQPPYNMISRGVETDLLSYCARHEIGVVAYSPMQNGLLTGKFTPERVKALPEEDWRRRSRRFREPELSANLALVEKLRRIGERNGRTVAQLAIAWVLRRPEVTSAIVGARSAAQIEETAAAADTDLTAGEIAEIEALLHERDRMITP